MGLWSRHVVTSELTSEQPSLERQTTLGVITVAALSRRCTPWGILHTRVPVLDQKVR